MQCALHDAEADLTAMPGLHSVARNRILGSLKHAPIVMLMRNAFPALVSVPNPPVHCEMCAKRHEESVCSTQGMPSGYVSELRFRTAKITASAASGGAAVSFSKAKNAADITAAMDELGWSSHSHRHLVPKSTTSAAAAVEVEAAAAATDLSPEVTPLSPVLIVCVLDPTDVDPMTVLWSCRQGRSPSRT